MTEVPDGPNPLLRQLQWVHSMLRRDLQTCRELAEAARTGASAVYLRDELARLGNRSPLFHLKINCLRYCQLVHTHHAIEDIALFPGVRSSAPALSPVVDRLEADHRRVSVLLDDVEAAARDLDDDAAGHRERLVTALTDLSAHLLEHLALEEEVLGPVLATWSEWPHG